ncbi:MAG: cation transporter [Chlorobi bacterium]|nr:cation transporter [Chlorobiota bacterium]
MIDHIENKKIKLKAAKISLIVGSFLLVVKFAAYFITDSTAILSDAAESVINIVASAVALYSVILSSKPADKDHPYGHGNIEYFSAGFEGFLIALAGVVIIYTSIIRIIAGTQPSKLGIGIFLIAASSIINLILSLYLIKNGKKTDSLALIADGKHILTDVYTSGGIIIGLIIVMFTDIYIFDPIIAMLVAVNIFFTGSKLVRQSVGGLMNEVEPETLSKISQILIDIRRSYWIDLHELRFWRSASRTFIDFHLVLPFYFSIKRAHDSDDLISVKIKEVLPDSQIKIHLDYCGYELCKFCEYQECNVRAEELSTEYKWDQERLTGPGLRKLSGYEEP